MLLNKLVAAQYVNCAICVA